MLKRISFLFAFCAAALTQAQPFGDRVALRGSLDNARIKFSQGGKATVAFLGGSITEMEGYRPMVCDILRKRFPQTEFTFVNAGISSTCSTTGSFRLERDVLSRGPVDLLFVEFAVNDDQDAHHSPENCIRGMEGVVRHARIDNPEMDVVMTFFVNEHIMDEINSGKVPLTIQQHTKVAEHYKISTINLAAEVTEQISSGKLTWQKFGGVHPAPFGNAIASAMIDELLNRAWKDPLEDASGPVAHVMPAAIDDLSYFNGRFVDVNEAELQCGCIIKVPEWDNLKGSKRSRYTACPTLCAEGAGAEFSLDFEGRAVGAFITAGPDAGLCEYSVDGAQFRTVDLFRHYSKGLHYPYTVVFANDLAPGKHRLTVRMLDAPVPGRNALRIMQFCVN